jgi:hypothetical protein
MTMRLATYAAVQFLIPTAARLPDSGKSAEVR